MGGRFESNILVQNQREQCRVLQGPGDCWQWQASGQCPKGDNCSFRHDTKKRAKPTTLPRSFSRTFNRNMGKTQQNRKVLEAEVRLGKNLACHARIILRVLARIHLVKSGIPQSACFTCQKRDANSGKSARSHTSGWRNSPAKGPKEMSIKVL